MSAQHVLRLVLKTTPCKAQEYLLRVVTPTPSTDAASRAEALREAGLALTLNFQGQTLGLVTISVGVAALRGRHRRPEELLRQADQALYQAEKEGRNRVWCAGNVRLSPS